MTENQQENEKLLSFKERILRDLEEANKQIVQVEKEYDLPVQKISIPENKEDETEESLSDSVSEESKVQETVEIPEEVEKVEVPGYRGSCNSGSSRREPRRSASTNRRANSRSRELKSACSCFEKRKTGI